MRASDIMTKSVRTVAPDARVREIARLLLRHRISAVPVVDAKRRVIGIVSESDLMRRPEAGAATRRSWWLDLLTAPNDAARDYAKTHGLRARDVMAKPVVSVAPTAALADVVDAMERARVKRVPVISGGRLVGIVSRHDVLRAVARTGGGRRKTSDGVIAELLRKRIRGSGWALEALINITVAKGVVQLGGLVPDEDRRRALRIMAERVPGVRLVKDQLQVQRIQSYI